MPQPYASGNKSIGICDRCGEFKPLKELKWQIRNMQNTNWLVCSECLDPDHPQYQIGRYPINDPQALQYPRPDPLTDRTVDNSAYAALLAWLNSVQR